MSIYVEGHHWHTDTILPLLLAESGFAIVAHLPSDSHCNMYCTNYIKYY